MPFLKPLQTLLILKLKITSCSQNTRA